jgi:hypothetical protein
MHPLQQMLEKGQVGPTARQEDKSNYYLHAIKRGLAAP